MSLELVFQPVGRKPRRRIHDRFVDDFRIDGVTLEFFIVLDDAIFESVAPQNLVGQIGRTGLHRVTRRFVDPFHDDDQFETLLEKILSGHGVERTVFVDGMDDGHGPKEKQGVLLAFDVGSTGEFRLMIRNHFTLFGYLIDQKRAFLSIALYNKFTLDE